MKPISMYPFLCMCSLCLAQPDSALIEFNLGARTYDSTLLKKAMIVHDTMSKTPDYLFQATCLWRIQLIKYVLEDKKGIREYGFRALDLLDSAEKKSQDSLIIIARRAYVCQLIAGSGGFRNGAVYGPRTSKYLKRLKKNQPEAFDTRFIEAVNLLEMPRFVGGSPEKALPALEKLHREFPDSSAVSITLARALNKVERYDESRAILDAILSSNPNDLWAKLVRREIP